MLKAMKYVGGDSLTLGDIILLLVLIVGAVVGILYFLNKWAYKKMGEQQEIIERTRQTVTLFVIDKKRDKVQNANLPKSVIEQMPKYSKFLKMYLVKAKIGPQILTLICDKKVFNALPVKKTVKVDLAGIYITEMKGMKTDEELKALKKAKKEKEKAAKKADKNKA